MRTVQAAPSASILIESMRDIGYSLDTALADVIDNSIAARATNIQLFAAPGDTELKIGILDDGVGMTEEELLSAMRLGSRNPLEQRKLTDLGRFGLGLKTASFSQGRRLTVVTKHDGRISAARWDLDRVSAADDWVLGIPDDPQQLPWADRLGNTGTLVIWERLDRVVEKNRSDRDLTQFVRRIDQASDHLELVFHRFLSGEPGLRKVRIYINDRPLGSLDPFHARHLATVAGPVEKIKVGDEEVVVRAFTLPHHQKVTPEEWERLAGREGYLKNQGFYVYREKRLIVYGTWFGLARQTELTKLARVRIDMPNGLDSEWKIDVKKASAQPPYQVRDRLRGIIDTIGASSKRAYTIRGRKLVDDNRIPIWKRSQDKGSINYRVNAEHPVLADFAKGLSVDQMTDFRRILEIIGSALPTDTLYADMGSEPGRLAGKATSEDALIYAATTTYRILLGAGMPSEDVLNAMQVAEPFLSNWPRTSEILNLEFKLEDLNA